MPLNSRDKGQRGELELARYLQERGHTGARRGQQFKGGIDAPDVCGLPGFHIECKRVEERASGSVYGWLEQAERDADGKAVPIVVHRRNRKPWVVILTLEDFLTIIPNPLGHAAAG